MAVLKASGLGKVFPGVVALDGVDLELRGGCVHALIGANGAGKSTLIKILTGYYSSYEGKIELNGQVISIHKPADAFRYGIEVVHQEVDTTLIPYLSVAENLLIEKLATPEEGFFVRKKRLHDEARQILQKLQLDIDVDKPVADLSLPQKQLLVIARAMSRNASFLILDEPTAALSVSDVEHLFNIIRKLKQRGVSFLYVSHRLAEIQEIADDITILRGGKKVAHFNRETFEMSKAVEAMLGTRPGNLFPTRIPTQERELVLEVRNIRWGKRLNNISIQAFRGEILGITGLTGAGKTELLNILAGSEKADHGDIILDGKVVHFRQPKDAIRHGIFLIPEDRRHRGLWIEYSVRTNITLPFIRDFSYLSFVLPFKEIPHVLHIINRLKLVPPDPGMAVKNLSGGNQQKVVIGKWLLQRARVMLFDEATQGIDIGAKQEVYALARELSRTSAVIFASSDVDEVLSLADRVLVMRDGQIVGEFDSRLVARQQVMELAIGAVHTKTAHSMA
ncbi:sugar ABC transporter ATP-binding protein [Chloroflexus sp. Y-396-1]|uniref:sugar ABC transporter ATP-binding protein n=1 Tax=Chloroflexus sp. Y-396-1 TaxID=867845 RepID=UPI0004B69866|nr:sugar ABC transporter ATP-binding protein [Chloroflexus sp. Y-396-1]